MGDVALICDPFMGGALTDRRLPAAIRTPGRKVQSASKSTAGAFNIDSALTRSPKQLPTAGSDSFLHPLFAVDPAEQRAMDFFAEPEP